MRYSYPPFTPLFTGRGGANCRTILFVLLLLLFINQTIVAQEATFPRYPAVSPNGENIAFNYAGDIWTVSTEGGRAYRLTVHSAYDHTPRWSPDGNWIAFSANREGDDDVYVIPSLGGQTTRLTYLDTDDKVCDWSSDSQYIIFSSRRDHRYPDFPMLYRVPIDGGTPTTVMDAFGHSATVSSDGSEMLYVRNGMQWWRKHYRGSKAAEVWKYRFDSGEQIAITDTINYTSGNEFRRSSSLWTMWGYDGALFVVSDRDGTFNLWERQSDQWTQITHYENSGVRFPSISRDGRVIAYEQGLNISVIEENGTPRLLEIIAPLDNPNQSVETVHYSDKANQVEFSSDEKQMFFDVRGELFAGRIVSEDDEEARGRANSISGNNPARDHDFTVSPGGDSLIFVSDRNGSKDLFLAYSDDPNTTELSRSFHIKVVELVTSSEEEQSPKWSPDGQNIAFIRGKGDLYIYDLMKKSERQLLSGWSLLQYEWSPDGKWIAYAREDNEYNSDVFVILSAGGESVNVSRHPDEDEFPVWSKDGKKLGFRSRRRQNNWDIYSVFLQWEDHQKNEADWAEEIRVKSSKKRDDEDDDKGKKKEKKEDKPELVEVIIDTTDIYRRVKSVTNLAGDEGQLAISPDGKTFVFTSDHEQKRDLYAISWNGKDIKRLTEGGVNPHSFSFDKKGKSVRYLDNSGHIKSVPVEGGKVKGHPFDAYLIVNSSAERQQKFDEIWRTLNDRFYDANFHGQNWDKIGVEYGEMIKKASCEKDFGDIINMMFGELNASHMGYRSPYSNNGHTTGHLGLDYDPTDDGPGLLISKVIPYGPATRDISQVKVGERILTINGVVIEKDVNIYKLLDNQVDQPVELIVANAKGKKERRVSIRPMNSRSHGWLRYDEWVKDRRAMVDSMSDGKLGYLHIRGMGDPSLARFEAQLYSVANGKDGLVIDVRYNGGGWTTDYLLSMLQVKRHAVTYPRDGGAGYPQSRLPLYSWVKPIIVLCNEHSFSNAEIFSHAIKTLERGSLVGVPTPGGVISTGGNGLIDGSGFRIPLRGWYAGTTAEPDPVRNMEGNGAVPDIIVPMQPGQMAAGKDIQLERAVIELINQSEIRDE